MGEKKRPWSGGDGAGHLTDGGGTPIFHSIHRRSEVEAGSWSLDFYFTACPNGRAAYLYVCSNIILHFQV